MAGTVTGFAVSDAFLLIAGFSANVQPSNDKEIMKTAADLIRKL